MKSGGASWTDSPLEDSALILPNQQSEGTADKRAGFTKENNYYSKLTRDRSANKLTGDQ